jgi:hypothetical protein
MSPQTDYSQEMPVAVAGLQVDGRHDNHVVSAAAEEVVRFGLAVVRKSDDWEVGRLPGANQVVITDDGGTWTAGDLVSTVNGVTVTTTYATSKTASMTAHAASIQALAFVTTATYAGGSDTITVVADADVYLSISTDVSGITGTMTISGYTHSSTDSILGLATREVKSYGSARNRVNDKVVCTLSGDALAANDTISGTINGVAFDTVTYATSEANTLQLLANELMENSGVASAVVSGRTVTVYNNPTLEVEISLTVTDDTLASVAPSFAYTYSKQDTGVTLEEAAYLATETMSVTRRGALWVKCEESVSVGDTPYVRVATGTGSQRGAFRNDADSGSCQDVSSTFGTFMRDAVQDPDGDYIAPLEVNLP